MTRAIALILTVFTGFSGLVYEVRVFVKDPSDTLRLGMPATVYLPRHQPGPQATEGQQ